MKRVPMPIVIVSLLLAIALPVGAQNGWFSQNGTNMARASTSNTAVTIRQDGTGAILDLYAGATRVLRATSASISSSVATLFPAGTAAAPSVAIGTNAGIFQPSDGTLAVGNYGQKTYAFGVNNAIGLSILDTYPLSWASEAGGSPGTWLIPDGAGILKLTHSLKYSGVAFAALGTPGNGVVTYCTDCTKATPCAGSGTGAIAKRINGAWDCD